LRDFVFFGKGAVRIKTEDFTFQTLAYFKYTQENVKNEWRQNNESFEILIKVSSELSLLPKIYQCMTSVKTGVQSLYFYTPLLF